MILSARAHIIRLIVLILTTCFSCSQVMGREVVDKLEKDIPQNVLDRFDQAIVELDQEWTNEFVDSLYSTSKSITKKSGYAVLADILQSYKAYMKEDSATFFDLSEKIKEETRRKHYMSLYYNQHLNQVLFYLETGHAYQAQKTAKSLIDEAMKAQDDTGLRNGYVSLAIIYSQLQQYHSAIECYIKAMGMKLRPNVKAQLLYHVSYNYSMLGMYDDAIHYALQSIETSPTEPEAPLCLAYSYYNKGMYDKFKEYMKKANARKDINMVKETSRYQLLSALEKAVEGDYDKAIEICTSIDDERVTFEGKSEVYKMQGNWQMAYEFFRLSKEHVDSAQKSNVEGMLIDANDRIAAVYMQNEADRIQRQSRLATACTIFISFIVIISIAFVITFYNGRYRLQKNRIALAEEFSQRMTQAKQAAERANKLKTMFMQNMSHDVRTPLNAIIGFSQLLGLPDGCNTQEEKDRYNRYIGINSEMLIMLLNDILNINDIEQGKFDITPQPIPCNTICQNVMKCVEYRIPDGVQFPFTSNVDDTYTIYTDGRRVQQVLINFLTNACKHTAKGEVRVICHVDEENKTVKFSVADTGEGVPAEMQPHIFQRFVTDEKEDSHGLGLSICRTIAEKMEGSVALDVSHNPGAKFDFTIPLLERPE